MSSIDQKQHLNSYWYGFRWKEGLEGYKNQQIIFVFRYVKKTSSYKKIKLK